MSNLSQRIDDAIDPVSEMMEHHHCQQYRELENKFILVEGKMKVLKGWMEEKPACAEIIDSTHALIQEFEDVQHGIVEEIESIAAIYSTGSLAAARGESMREDALFY